MGDTKNTHSLNISFIWTWGYDHALRDQEGSVTFVLSLYNYIVKYHDAFQAFMKVSFHLF